MKTLAISGLAVMLTAAVLISAPVLAQGKGRGGGVNKGKGGGQTIIFEKGPNDRKSVRLGGRRILDEVNTSGRGQALRAIRDEGERGRGEESDIPRIRIDRGPNDGLGGFFVGTDGLPPGLAKRQTLPPGLAKRYELPPGLAKYHATPPGLAKRGRLPPGLRR